MRSSGRVEDGLARLHTDHDGQTGVAQLVEQRSPKPQVAGSSPVTRALM